MDRVLYTRNSRRNSFGKRDGRDVLPLSFSWVCIRRLWWSYDDVSVKIPVFEVHTIGRFLMNFHLKKEYVSISWMVSDVGFKVLGKPLRVLRHRMHHAAPERMILSDRHILFKNIELLRTICRVEGNTGQKLSLLVREGISQATCHDSIVWVC